MTDTTKTAHQVYLASAENPCSFCKDNIEISYALKQKVWFHKHDSGTYPCTALTESELLEQTAKDLEEWRSYWGCDSPHDSHVSMGTSDKSARQLGTEQERANRLEHERDDLKELLEQRTEELAQARADHRNDVVVLGTDLQAEWLAARKLAGELEQAKAENNKLLMVALENDEHDYNYWKDIIDTRDRLAGELEAARAALRAWERFAAEANLRKVVVPAWAAALNERAVELTRAALEPKPSGKQRMLCTLCGGPAEFIDKENVWRHAGKPYEDEYLDQSACDKYGYPIEVRAALEPGEQPA